MNKKLKTYFLFEVLNYFIVVCFFVRGSILTNKLTLIWGIISCCFLAYSQKKIRIDVKDVLLSVSLILYVVFTDKSFSWGG